MPQFLIPELPLAATGGFDPTLVILLAAIAGLVVGVLGLLIILKAMGNAAMSRSKLDADKLIADAKSRSDDILREAQISAKDAALKLREQAEREIDTMREEMRNIEQRLLRREDTLDQKLDTLATKEKNLESIEKSINERNKTLLSKEKQLDESLTRQKEILLQVTNLSFEDAKQLLLKRVEGEVRHDMAVMVEKLEEQAKDEAKQKSTNIMLQAMQRYAAE